METRGDILIQVLWEYHIDLIIDIKFGDADTDTYKHEPMDNIMICWEKKNMGNTCSAKVCEKNGKVLRFIPHIYFSLFYPFMNIFTLFSNNFLY